MKKIAIITVLALTLFSLSAAFVPFSYDRTSPLFSSPSRILEEEENTPFGFMVDLSSDIKGLSFLSSPLSVTEEASKNMVRTLEKKDAEWWKNNPEVISVFSSYDASFPTPTFDSETESLELWKIRNYLSSTFLSSSYTKERRAYVVSALANDGGVFSENEKIGGDTDFFLSLFGENVKDGFGWGWNVNLGFDGSDRLFGGGKSIFSVDARGEIGYAFPLSEKVALGISCIPSLRMETYILTSSYTLSRLQSNMLSLFTEDFRFGMGIELNLGLSYKVNEELSFTLDGRNIPSLYTYWGITLGDMASFNLNFNRLKDTWIELPDAVVAAHWKRGGHRVDVVMDSIVSQMLWMKEVDGYEFDFLLCPKIQYSYYFAPEKSITAYLENSMIAFGLDYNGFSFSLSYILEDNNIGIKTGYRF